jgi:hypothetical protein
MDASQVQNELSTELVFDSMSADLQQHIRMALTSESKRTTLNDCWLLPTQEQIDDINQTMPMYFRLSPMVYDDVAYVSIDYLIDCLRDSSPFHQHEDILRAVPVKHTDIVRTRAAQMMLAGSP